MDSARFLFEAGQYVRWAYQDGDVPAGAAGVVAAATTNGNSGTAAAKSTLKYNPIGE